MTLGAETIGIQNRTTQLRGKWVWIVRALWLALVVFTLALEASHVSSLWRERTTVCEGPPCFGGYLWASDVPLLEEIGLTVELHAWYYILVDILPSVVALIGVGLVLAWLRSDDWLALYTSLWLIMLADFKLPVATWGIAETIHAAIVLPTIIILMLIFPNGRFVPRWAWIPAIPMAGFMIYVAILPVDAPIWFAWVAFGLNMLGAAALLYRYHLISDEAQRRQIKWVVWVFPLRPLLELGVRQLIFPLLPIVFTPGLPRVFFHMITFPLLSTVPFVLTAVALGVAITRYRLWDIDFFINRALVYAALTAGLGVAFGAVFFVLRPLLVLLLGGDQAGLAAIMATAAAVGLFAPVRTAIRRFVDRRFYGIGVDYVQAVKEYHKLEQVAVREKTKTSFGGYTSLELVGRGGMGEVYLAQHPTLNRAVAIKILPAHLEENEESHKRFMREAQTIAALKHPNIVTLHDVGEQDGSPFMVMEYIEGPTLADLLRERGRLALSDALPILNDVAAALDYAHGQGIIHRDIKPSNVIVETPPHPPSPSPTGEGEKAGRAVLMDFGIARIAAASQQLTRSGGFIGTLDYVSPEQIQGASEVDGRADVYSLGVMAYQLLTGELPFKHSNPGAMVMAHLMQPPPDPRQVAPDLPESAAHAIMQAMSKKPDERFATAGEMVAALG